jgi:UDP-2,3-diacylglucosamine hydrolase
MTKDIPTIPAIALPEGQSVYFASDLHLGSPDREGSRQREDRFIRWLDKITPTAAAIFLVGDLFDFWFEYKLVVPKGAVRLLGKLAQLRDEGLPIFAFSGNHDVWMKDYFPTELGIPVYHRPHQVKIGDKLFFVGHGDGLGPKDAKYKVMKKVFRHPLSYWLYRQVHPDLGIRIANFWSGSSRKKNLKIEEPFLGEEEWLLQYSRRKEAIQHHDYYIFGHRHLPMEIEVGPNSKYVNIGDWVSYFTYAEFDGRELHLRTDNR